MTKRYLSVQKHERIAKLMRFIEEHPGLSLEELAPMAIKQVYQGRHTTKKIESYFYSLLREGDIYASTDGKVYPTPRKEAGK